MSCLSSKPSDSSPLISRREKAGVLTIADKALQKSSSGSSLPSHFVSFTHPFTCSFQPQWLPYISLTQTWQAQSRISALTLSVPSSWDTITSIIQMADSHIFKFWLRSQLLQKAYTDHHFLNGNSRPTSTPIPLIFFSHSSSHLLTYE